MCIPGEAEGGVPGVVAVVSSEAVVEGVGVVGEGVGGDVGGVGSGGVVHGSVRGENLDKCQVMLLWEA